jgi:hypothetical protein
MSTLQRFSRSLLVVVHSEILIPKRLLTLGQLRAIRRFSTVGIGGGGNPPDGLHQAALRAASTDQTLRTFNSNA